MLIGEATLTSPAFSPRLMLLVGELQRAGCTVWLEGLRLRFDCAEADAGALRTLLKRYDDVVAWSPPQGELTQVSPRPRVPLARSKRRFTADDA